MGSVIDRIYKKARHYLNTRQNDVHISISYGLARQLLKHYPEADEAIVLPAILLHDVGWSIVPEEKQIKAFGPKAKDYETQRLHEVEGARIAEKILNSLNYGEEKIHEIVTIIDGHDSRHQPLSLNDALVKDADKLWRYTVPAIDIDHVRFGTDLDSHVDYLRTMLDRWFLTPVARDVAHKILGRARGL